MQYVAYVNVNSDRIMTSRAGSPELSFDLLSFLSQDHIIQHVSKKVGMTHTPIAIDKSISYFFNIILILIERWRSNVIDWDSTLWSPKSAQERSISVGFPGGCATQSSQSGERDVCGDIEKSTVFIITWATESGAVDYLFL